MSWIAPAISAGGSILGGLLGSHGAHHAANAQLGFEKKYLAPFFQAGQSALPDLQYLSSPVGRSDFLNQFYGGQEFQTQEREADRNILANAEATGNLGSSSTQNTLARVAPNLGMNALSQQIGQLTGLAKIGFGGASQLASQGALAGQAAAAPYQGASAALNQLTNLGTLYGLGAFSGQGQGGGSPNFATPATNWI